MNKNYEFKQIVVTLYEGHYHFGVAALINSLVNASFQGLICIGYRGRLPIWINQLTKNDAYYNVNDSICLEFVFLDVNMHFGYYKPYFIKEVFEKNKNADKIYYFDPDIVINSPWFFFTRWVECGVALCLDVCFGYLHHNHPWRKEWLLLGNSNRISDINFYVNSGFLGVQRESQHILDLWINITDKYKEKGMNVISFEQSNASSAFKGDQDLLNAAITIAERVKFSIMGTEGMGFTMPAYIMSHAVGDGTKPWKRNFLKTVVIKGIKPTIAETDYLRYCNYPITVYSSYLFNLKMLNFKLSKIIGRFWHN